MSFIVSVSTKKKKKESIGSDKNIVLHPDNGNNRRGTRVVNYAQRRSWQRDQDQDYNLTNHTAQPIGLTENCLQDEASSSTDPMKLIRTSKISNDW